MMRKRLANRGFTPTLTTIAVAMLWLAVNPVQGVRAELSGPPAPAKGMLLVATEQIKGSTFRQSVILLTTYSEKGAMGLIVNKPFDVKLPPALDDQDRFAQQIFLGGPMGRRTPFALTRAKDPDLPPKARIIGNLFLVTGLRQIAAVAKGTNLEMPLHVYLGHAGWAPGQLQREIERGDWVVAPMEDDDFFDTPGEELWRTLLQRWSGDWI